MNPIGAQYVTPSGPATARRRRLRHARGFTLIELMITIAVAAVLLAVAVPSFKHLLVSNKLTTTANDLVAAMHLARMTAIKRNAETQFCSNNATNNDNDTLGSACGTHAGAVFTTDGSGAAVKILAATDVAQGEQQLNGDIVALRYSAQGLAHKVGQGKPYTGKVADICTTAASSQNHRVIKMITGSIIRVETSGGSCI